MGEERLEYESLSKLKNGTSELDPRLKKSNVLKQIEIIWSLPKFLVSGTANISFTLGSKLEMNDYGA